MQFRWQRAAPSISVSRCPPWLEKFVTQRTPRTQRKPAGAGLICSLIVPSNWMRQFAPDSQSSGQFLQTKIILRYNQLCLFSETIMRSSSNAMLSWAVLKSGSDLLPEISADGEFLMLLPVSFPSFLLESCDLSSAPGAKRLIWQLPTATRSTTQSSSERPNGLTTPYSLARAGKKVLVLERRHVLAVRPLPKKSFPD